jgi:hypothetical protein
VIGSAFESVFISGFRLRSLRRGEEKTLRLGVSRSRVSGVELKPVRVVSAFIRFRRDKRGELFSTFAKLWWTGVWFAVNAIGAHGVTRPTIVPTRTENWHYIIVRPSSAG